MEHPVYILDLKINDRLNRTMSLKKIDYTKGTFNLIISSYFKVKIRNVS